MEPGGRGKLGREQINQDDMRIKCISNLGDELPDDCLKPDWGFTQEKEFALVLGKVYPVYAFTVLFGYIWYFICDENYSFYPVWNPSPLFIIVDHRLSRFWELNSFIGGSAVETQTIVAFPEWAKDRLFYDRLTNGDMEAVRIFHHYKMLIDAEHEGVADGGGASNA
jgi:hypothetical protein